MNRTRATFAVVALCATAATAVSAQDQSVAIYNEDVVATFQLTMNATDWNKIVNDPFGQGDLYQPATLTWQGETVTQVGVKATGKASRRVGNPKPPIKIKFDEFVPNRLWKGVDMVRLDSLKLDYSALRDRLTYWAYRQAGAWAPRSCNARLIVNGDLKGLYEVEEPIRKAFARFRWSGGQPVDGNLYEIDYADENGNGHPQGTDQYIWRGTIPGSYVPKYWHPETNSVGGNHQDVVDFINVLINAAPVQRRTQLEGLINMDAFLSYLAVTTATANFDSIFSWGVLGSNTPNNHYWYHRENTNRLEIIAWDVENAFGNQYFTTNPPSGVGNGQYRTTQDIWFGFNSTRATSWIQADSVASATLRSKIQQFLNGPLSQAAGRVDFISGQIRGHVSADPYKPFSLAQFDAEVQNVKNWIARRMTYLRSQFPTISTVTVTASDNTAAEPSSTGTFRIDRSGSTATALTVRFATTGTATSQGDYNSLGTSVLIPAGSASATVTVTPVDDGSVESSETVILTISSDAAYTVGNPSSATVTIADNDAPLPTVTISATDPNAAEPSVTGAFAVTRTGSTTAALTVPRVRTGTATSGTDFQGLPSPITIPAGQASVTVTVTPIDDTLVEGSETVILTISADPAYTVGTASSATVTIADNDTNPTLPTVTIVATDDTAAEPSSVGVFTVTRTGATTAALTVPRVRTGTATSGTDFQGLPSPITIPAGQASVMVTVTPIDDAAVEGSETVILTISADPAYTVGTASSATVTIADNDTNPTLPTVTIVATDDTAAEPSSVGVFTVTRTGATTAALTVPRVRTGTATSGTDFQGLPSPITIPAGQASVTVTVTPIDDTLVEGSETVILTISADPAYTVGTASSATVTITDNDTNPPPPTLPTVTIVATDDTAAEPSSVGVFTVTRTGATTAALTVPRVRTGTATSGTDFQGLPSPITIPAGQASVTVTVTPIDDTAVEGPETVILTISADPAYTVGTASSATVTIADNETASGSGLSATYYDNPDFTGTSVTRTDPTVDFDWVGQSPAPGIAADTFSSRWTGRVRAQYGETYTFYTFTNDGARLWVEGELLVDRWVQQSGGIEWSGQVALQAGRWYTIQMDHYEGVGNAVARLSWSSASTAKQVVPQSALSPALGAPDSRDNDGDGIPNDTDPDDDNDGIPDLQDPDRDGDTVTNLAEHAAGTDPNDQTSPGGPGGGPAATSTGDNPNGDAWINDRCAGGSIGAGRRGLPWQLALLTMSTLFLLAAARSRR